MVKAKIICTIGPTSANRTTLRKMMLEGMDVIRLNFSHGTVAEHQNRIDLIRELNKKYRRHIKILQDLEGYRIRIGKFKGKRAIKVKKRQIILLTNKDKISANNIIPFNYQGLLSDIKIGAFIYIDDGDIALRVRKRSRDYIQTEVVIPGTIKENKGINIPGAKLRFKGITKKDKQDLEFGIRNKADFIAQSFVRNKQDIINLKELIKNSNFKPKIIAKIENRQGIKNLDEILRACDGIMIARGDLGVSLPIYQIPILQKMIIKKCNGRRKFVITATQMLESMTENIRPTRAEVTDVANAILDGSDFLMLSGETAVGRNPVKVVRMMNQIIKFTEKHTKPSLTSKMSRI